MYKPGPIIINVCMYLCINADYSNVKINVIDMPIHPSDSYMGMARMMVCKLYANGMQISIDFFAWGSSVIWDEIKIHFS